MTRDIAAAASSQSGASAPERFSNGLRPLRAFEVLTLSLGLALAVWLCLESQAWRIPQVSRSGVEATLAKPSGSYLRVGLAYLGVLAVYGLWMWHALARRAAPAQVSTFAPLLLLSSPALALAFAAYPTTTDPYAYLHAARMWASGANPYLIPAARGVSELSPWIVWPGTSPYGPVSLLIFLGPSLLVPTSLTGAVYALKALCLASHVGSAYGLWLLLKGSFRRTLLTVGYLLCPILLVEQVQQGHADVFVNLLFVAALVSVARARAGLGLCLVVVAVLTKTLPALWIPFFLLPMAKNRDWQGLLGAFAFTSAALVLCAWVFLPTPRAWSSLLNPGVKWHVAGSFHHIVYALGSWLSTSLPAFLKVHRIYLATTAATTVAFLAWFGSLVWRAAKGGAPELRDTSVVCGRVLLILFMFATPWYQPWYVTVLAPMVVIALRGVPSADERLFAFATAMFAVSSASYHVLSLPYSSETSLLLASILTTLPTAVLITRRRGDLFRVRSAPDSRARS